MKVDDKHVHSCPQCGRELSRVHRHLDDRVVGVLEKVRRYRCTNPECEWEGIVSIPAAPEVATGAPPVTWKVRVAWMLVGAAIALAGVAGLKLYRSTRAPEARVATIRAPEPMPVPAGDNFDGHALAADDVRVKENPTDLSVRRGCAWGIPGGNPYRGTARQAMVAARLPEEVVSKVEAMIDRGLVSDRVVITRDSINTTSGKRRFDTTMVAMGFGRTLCFGARVNFQPGHVEVADLYDATDASGTNFSIMVPYVCRNISVITERIYFRPGNGGGWKVPEPGTLAGLLACLLAMAAAARLRGPRAEPRSRGQAQSGPTQSVRPQGGD